MYRLFFYVLVGLLALGNWSAARLHSQESELSKDEPSSASSGLAVGSTMISMPIEKRGGRDDGVKVGEEICYT